jgi:hypothetical protein
MAVDEAWHEESAAGINLPTSGNGGTANGPDSVTRYSDIIRALSTAEPRRFSRCLLRGRMHYRRWISYSGSLCCVSRDFIFDFPLHPFHKSNSFPGRSL